MTFEKYEISVAPQVWRILIQIAELQPHEYKQERDSTEREKWIIRIWETLCRINQKAETFTPSQFPADIKPPTAESAALAATGENWCLRLSQELTVLFMCVPIQIVNISRIKRSL